MSDSDNKQQSKAPSKSKTTAKPQTKASEQQADERGDRGPVTSNMRQDQERAFNDHRSSVALDPLERIKPNRGDDRVSMGSQANLSNVIQFIQEGFTPYWHLTKEVEAAANGGYGIVRDNAGNIVRRPAGDGTNELILMEIPSDIWDRDQRSKRQKAIDAMGEAGKIDESKQEYSLTGTDQSVVATSISTSPFTE